MDRMRANDMLKDEITKVNYTLIPPGCKGTVRLVQESLGKVIDALGEQSAAAQGLSKIITTSEKLRQATTHVLYLLKDAAEKNGDGEVIGFLKVAYKKLYLYDDHNQVRQVEPLCVLDFFVKGAKQRHGNGKRLFDYMLRDTDSRPQDLAVDGPSAKMESFLAKNYGVERLVKQTNNFAVSSAFFSTTPDISKSGRSTPLIPAAAVGRFAARQPQSSISDVIHGEAGRLFVDTNNGRRTPEPKLKLSSGAVPEPEPEPVPELILDSESVPESDSEPDAVPAPPSPNPERPTTLPVAPAVPSARSLAGSTYRRRDSQLTDRGHFDVKFYHNKLCKSGRSTPLIPAAAVGRFAARQPQSSISDVIHGGAGRLFVDTNNGRRTPEPKLKLSSGAVPEPEPEPVPELILDSESVPESDSEPDAVPAPPSPNPERPTTLPVAPAVPSARSLAGSTYRRRDSQLTDRGHFDVKFYHNKLW